MGKRARRFVTIKFRNPHTLGTIIKTVSSIGIFAVHHLLYFFFLYLLYLLSVAVIIAVPIHQFFHNLEICRFSISGEFEIESGKK